jgi:hypothetical protein
VQSTQSKTKPPSIVVHVEIPVSPELKAKINSGAELSVQDYEQLFAEAGLSPIEWLRICAA